MWEDFIEVASGPWQVGIRFDRASSAAVARAAFGESLIPEDPARPFAVGVRTRRGAGTTVFHGTTPLARTAGEPEMIEALAWFLAGVADARRGVDDTTSLRVVLGESGAVLVSAPRPFLLGAHAWRHAGLVQLALVDVRVADTGDALVLPDPSSALLGRTRRWAGTQVPVIGLVARASGGERRDATIERLRPEFRGPVARAVLDGLRDAGRVRTGTDRARLLRQVLTLTA